MWSLPESDRCEHDWLSWITGQLHKKTTKGYCKLPKHARSAWNHLTESLLGSIRSLKCHSTASDECWLSAWKHTVALLDPIPLILFCCIYHTLCFHVLHFLSCLTIKKIFRQMRKEWMFLFWKEKTCSSSCYLNYYELIIFLCLKKGCFFPADDT